MYVIHKARSQGKSIHARPLHIPAHAKLSSTEGLEKWVWGSRDVVPQFSVNWPKPRLKTLVQAIQLTLMR